MFPAGPVGVRRRLQGLVAIGWCYAPLATELGVTRRSLSRLVEGHECFDDLYRRVVATYDRLLALGAPLDTSEALGMRGYARWRGWVLPDAWSGRSIDDPAARPLTSRVCELIEDLEWMASSGETWAGACQRLQMTRDGLYVALQRAGRGDLWNRLTAAAA